MVSNIPIVQKGKARPVGDLIHQRLSESWNLPVPPDFCHAALAPLPAWLTHPVLGRILMFCFFKSPQLTGLQGDCLPSSLVSQQFCSQ